MKQLAKTRSVLRIGEREIPVETVVELRRTVRFSSGKNCFYLRVPPGLSKQEMREYGQKFHDWIAETLETSEVLNDRFTESTYRTGDELQVGEYTYRLTVEETNNKSSSAKLSTDGTEIQLRLATGLPPHERTRHIRTLLSRVVGGHRHADMERRLQELNERHFRVPVSGLRMKNNRSNWGSCSAKGNINLSTRLLFAPPEVRDYVMIHELAHRIEMNHSEKFWTLVARAMPDYKQHLQWLRRHGASCEF